LRTQAKVGLLCTDGMLVPVWVRAGFLFLVGSGYGADSQILEFEVSTAMGDNPQGIAFGPNVVGTSKLESL
jgi:hypothetical protein